MTEAEQFLDFFVTVEIALLLHPGKNKDSVLRKVCNSMKHRVDGGLKVLLANWAKCDDRYLKYTKLLDNMGL